MTIPGHVTRARRALFLASFIEGAAVMVIELAGAKAIAPWYGTSLYVWGAVLGVTIGALALGYFLGGRLARRNATVGSLATLLIAGAVFTVAAPFVAPPLLAATASLELRLGALVGVALYLLPPVTCMGAVSPLIIQLVNRSAAEAGRSAGTVYAVSTVGGILATFLAGFYLLPEVGIRLTALLTGAVLAGLGLLLRYLLTDAALQASVAARRAPTAGTAASGALSVRLLLVVSFIEGGAVMVMELLGARIAAPYYGTSLYVWTSVLAVTLGALALGYFAGGWLSRRLPGEVTVFAVLLVAALLTAIAPSIAPPILLATDSLGVRLGAVAACLLYLLPPVACLGMVSPLITQLIDRLRDRAGESAGVVYAISTVGGILATFLAGFYLLPEAGIVTTALLTGGLLGSVTIGYFYATRRPAPAVVAIILGMVVVLAAPSPVTENSRARVVYRSSGILGEWTVLDSRPPASRKADDQTIERRLLLNGIDQTYTQLGFEPLSLWHYPHKIVAAASVKPAGSKALLLGMGGGSIAFELKAMGFDLDIVELDERIGQIAADYFRYDPAASRLLIDDARRYLRATTETYDVVAIDLLIGEVQPTHVFSLEGFTDLKARLRPGALVIVNFQGSMDDAETSLGPRSIYKTMRAAGFHVSYSLGSSEPGATDIVYVASLQEQDYRSLMQDLRYNQWFTYDHIEYEDLISDEVPRLDDAYLLVDDQPRLELLNAKSILDWRAGKLREHPRWMLRSGLPIYR